MKLEVAAGDRPTPGYVHHDARPLPDIEIVADMWDLPNHLEEGCCEELRATHILEHFSHTDTMGVLLIWHRLLCPGGALHIEVPNLAWQAHEILRLHEFEHQAEIVRLMYGDQDYEGNLHKTGFTESLLRGHLASAHFGEIAVLDIGAVLVADARSA
jgi:predicted SAM-dependent methyltransferase